MIWDKFIFFAIASVILSFAGAAFSAVRREGRSVPGIGLSIASSLVLASFIVLLWTTLNRPPLRTMGETRLWYSFFAGLAGLFTYCRWRYRWILPFSAVLSTVFIVINCLKPEIHDASLMPALQSPWFIPHVTVYMISYSVFGCAFLLSLALLFRKSGEVRDKEIFTSMDTLININNNSVRLCEADLKKLDTVANIIETSKNYEVDKYITKIDISDNTDYKLILEEEQKIVYLGSCTDLNTRILFMKEILNNEKGKKGELFINSNLSEHPAYFREAVN